MCTRACRGSSPSAREGLHATLVELSTYAHCSRAPMDPYRAPVATTAAAASAAASTAGSSRWRHTMTATTALRTDSRKASASQATSLGRRTACSSWQTTASSRCARVPFTPDVNPEAVAVCVRARVCVAARGGLASIVLASFIMSCLRVAMAQRSGEGCRRHTLLRRSPPPVPRLNIPPAHTTLLSRAPNSSPSSPGGRLLRRVPRRPVRGAV